MPHSTLDTLLLAACYGWLLVATAVPDNGEWDHSYTKMCVSWFLLGICISYLFF